MVGKSICNSLKNTGWVHFLLNSGWFKGLSTSFLSIHIPKILLTAEKERLDKELTIAQMQGKFKLSVVHNVGHSVQEDDYKATARIFYQFIKDFRIPMTLS